MSALHTGTGKPVNDRNRRIEYASDFYGNPDFSVGTLQALIDAGHEVVLAVTQPDKPKAEVSPCSFHR